MKPNIVNNDIYALIDRLQICHEIKYPDRKWTNETYYSIAWEWRGKQQELEKRVVELESEIR